jgi:hypothetical protein
MAAPSLEVLTVGRVGVDLYPEQEGPLAEVRTFAKFLGGTATNVAVGAARLGRRSAVLTKVGDDGFGTFVRTALAGFGVDPSLVGTSPDLHTPVAFCELNPPEDPPLLFYRDPVAPDLTLTERDVPWDVVENVPLLWVTGSGVSVEPARSTQLAMLAHGPCMAAPGYPMYYLNVLAGPGEDRSMAFCDDPAHGWVRGSWDDAPLDPRVPMTSAAGLVRDP